MLLILKPFNNNSAYGYLSLESLPTTTAVIGAIFLLLLIPLADEYVTTNFAATGYFLRLRALFLRWVGFTLTK